MNFKGNTGKIITTEEGFVVIKQKSFAFGSNEKKIPYSRIKSIEIDDKDKWYIGFDCAHAFDTTDFWTVNRVSDELRHIVGQILSEES